ncbi:hypothetical protein AFM16_20630 [Streptomyces antibioticus]|uniref:Uncharacterized protein n=1 Tax=Streptomyces antibioticus TaxID=1890 RepID=A0ABX3LHB4_STRAT|nr:hypothetical protein AFM16_20630 [Streptomyces antibioticus]
MEVGAIWCAVLGEREEVAARVLSPAALASIMISPPRLRTSMRASSSQVKTRVTPSVTTFT